MIDRPNQLSVADCSLIRHCLLYYEARITRLARPDEEEEVSIAVVNTIDTLRRLNLRLGNWVEEVDCRLDEARRGKAYDDDIPF